jgi:hypothetical protein
VARSISGVAFVSGVALALAIAVSLEAGVKVRTQRDETFDFRGLRTWAWHPSGAGDVRMAITPDDNPAAVRERFGPVIESAVQSELGKRQLVQAGDSKTPQLYVNYYVLLSTNMSAQTVGQFAPSVPEWGLPPFSGATQSLRVFEQGSLLIDVTAVSSGVIVWRGMVQAELHRDRAQGERDSRLRAAIGDLLKRFPVRAGSAKASGMPAR